MKNTLKWVMRIITGLAIFVFIVVMISVLFCDPRGSKTKIEDPHGNIIMESSD